VTSLSTRCSSTSTRRASKISSRLYDELHCFLIHRLFPPHHHYSYIYVYICMYVHVHQGLSDLSSGILRTPLAPQQTFADDPLRVLRAIRFGARFGFALMPELVEAASSEHVHVRSEPLPLPWVPFFLFRMCFVCAHFVSSATVCYCLNSFHVRRYPCPSRPSSAR
jgi:hypothetical protein